MVRDYSTYGPAYRNFKVRDGVYVPEPDVDFSGENPFTRMTPPYAVKIRISNLMRRTPILTNL